MLTQKQFSELPIPDQIKNNLGKQNITQLFEIQYKIYKQVKKFKTFDSILVQSPCGTGKTIATFIPVFLNLEDKNFQFVILVAPTEELLVQHYASLARIFEGYPEVFLFTTEEINLPAVSLLFRPVALPRTIIYIGTPIQVLKQLIEVRFGSEQVQEPLALIIDEADNQMTNNELTQLTQFLDFEPSCYAANSVARPKQIIFSSASLVTKLDLLNSIKMSPSLFITDSNEPQNELFRITFSPVFVYSLLFGNMLPLPALLILESADSVKAVTEKVIAGIRAGMLKCNVYSLLQGCSIRAKNITVEPTFVQLKLSRRSLAIAAIEDIRGIDYDFETVVVADQESEETQHALGRAGRGLRSGIRIQMVEGGPGQDPGSSEQKVESILKQRAQSLGQQIAYCDTQDVEELEIVPLEELQL